MGIRERLERARLKRALASERKRAEQKQKTAFETAREKREIQDLKEKRRLQQLRERKRKLQRQTGTGLRGAIARTEKARARIAKRRVSFSRRASRQRLAAFDVAGLPAPARARKVIKKPKKRKKRKRRKVTVRRQKRGFVVSFQDAGI